VYTSNKPGSVPCACTLVKKLSRVLRRTYDEALAGSGINITQLAVVRCIARRAGEPLSHVAEELEMDRSSLYRAIAPMVRDGWLEISAGADARSRSAKVTRKGERVLAKGGSGWDKVQDHLIGTFGKDSWHALVGELNRLADCADSLSFKRDGQPV
jgi:DNA-binding MarR family transcriptional regulator